MNTGRRTRTAAALALVIAAGLSGCAVAPEDDWETTHEPAWTVEATLLSDPLIAGDVVLAYASVGEGEEAMIAWDIDDGTELWRQITLPGRTVRGVDHWVAALEEDDGWQVSVLIPMSADAAVDSYSQVAILDARTGESLAEPLAERGAWTERPSVCGTDNRQFCVEGILEPNVNIFYDNRYVYSAEDPEFRIPDPADSGYFSGGYGLTDRLAVTDDDQLEYGEDGALMWARAYEDVFGDGATISGGWSWYDRESSADAPLVGVGSFHTEEDLSAPRELTSPFGDGTTVRLDRATGETLWSADMETCELTDHTVRIHDGIVPLCRFASGEVTLSWDGDSVENVAYANVDVDLVGVDVTTGQTAWSVPLGDAGWDGREEDLPAVRYPTGDEHILTTTADRGLAVIDVADGSVRELTDDQRVLCEGEMKMVELTSIWDDPIFPLAAIVSLCDADGERTDPNTIPTAAFAIAGYDLNEPMALNTPAGLSLYSPAAPKTPQD